MTPLSLRQLSVVSLLGRVAMYTTRCGLLLRNVRGDQHPPYQTAEPFAMQFADGTLHAERLAWLQRTMIFY